MREWNVDQNKNKERKVFRTKTTTNTQAQCLAFMENLGDRTPQAVQRTCGAAHEVGPWGLSF
jgi:hypothetical protein